MTEVAGIARPETVPWRCFHCDETFQTRESAAEHFGDNEFETERPLCVEAETSEMRAIVLTNRELWKRLRKVDDDLEQAEFERDCWAQAARKAVGDPYASWHDLGQIRREADGRVAAAEAALNAAPQWLRRFLRWKAEADWKRGRREMERLGRAASAYLKESGQ